MKKIFPLICNYQRLQTRTFCQISFMKKKQAERALNNIELQEPQKITQTNDQLAQILSQQLTESQHYDAKEMEELEQMHERHQELQSEINDQFSIPYNLYGFLNIPEKKVGYLIQRVFVHHRMPEHLIIEHLIKIFKGTLYSICEKDEEFLQEYLEKGFSDKLINQIKDMQGKGYTFQVVDDLSGIKGEPVLPEAQIIDSVMVRGLSEAREENFDESKYHKFQDIDEMGLVIYTPLELTNPESFIDPKKNATIYDDYTKVICRLLVYIKTPLRLHVFRSDGSQVEIDDNFYTWEHLAVFETQMKPPPKFASSYKLESYMEWLGKFQFGVWKLADLDNWMLGNPLVQKESQREMYKDKVFKGSKYDPKFHIDMRNI